MTECSTPLARERINDKRAGGIKAYSSARHKHYCRRAFYTEGLRRQRRTHCSEVLACRLPAAAWTLADLR